MSKESRKEKKAEKVKRKQEKAAVKQAEKGSRTILGYYPVREYVVEEMSGRGYFLMENQTIMDIVQIKGCSLHNASEDELSRMLQRQTYFYRRYVDDLKIVVLNFPANTKTQQMFLREKSGALTGEASDLMLSKIEMLQWLEGESTERQAFFMLFARDTRHYGQLMDLVLSAQDLNVQLIPQQKKEHVLFRLNNMNKIVKL